MEVPGDPSLQRFCLLPSSAFGLTPAHPVPCLGTAKLPLCARTWPGSRLRGGWGIPVPNCAQRGGPTGPGRLCALGSYFFLEVPSTNHNKSGG